MFNKNRDKIEPREKFNGMYRGKVVDVDDPYKKGRIRIEVFGVFDDLPVDTLPWAIFADPLMGGQENLGGFIVPDMDSHVWLFFEEGDHTQPVYFAGAPARPHGPPEATNGEYPRNKVFRTKAGHVIEIDDTPGETRVRIKHTSGTEVEVDDDGNVEEFVVGDVDRMVRGDVTEVIGGNYSRRTMGTVEDKSNGNMSFKAPRIDLN